MKVLSVNQSRLGVGLIQGLVFFLLLKSLEHGIWPALDAKIFAPFFLITLIVPALILLGLGNMRPRTLAAWALISTLILGTLAVHDIIRRSGLENNYGVWARSHSGFFPSFNLVFFAAVAFFIGQSLVMAADAEGKRIASYTRYFDIAWKLAVQLNFSAIFVGLYWLVLWMGASMFMLIEISFFKDLLDHNWFSMPVTTLAAAYAIHITDVRANLVRGIRTLKLTLLSWLAPVMALFVAGFLVSAPFKGLGLLWATHHTSQLLLGAAAWLILLVNAAYQDGAPEHLPVKVVRYGGTLGAVLLLPLTAIAAYALFVRVGEYGWTAHLVEVAACMFVAACYSAGYLVAAFPSGVWLRRLENTNIYVAFITLAVLLALFTPLADPARIAVADQVSRLEAGKVTADKFDYSYLRYEGGVYGVEALNRLKTEATGPDADKIKEKITQILAAKNKWEAQSLPTANPQDIKSNITVYPAGSVLPDTFINQDWAVVMKGKQFTLPQCLFNIKNKCVAVLIPATNESSEQILLMDEALYSNATIMQSSNGVWDVAGTISTRINCEDMHDALRNGPIKLVPSTAQDLDINGIRVQIIRTTKCPQ